MSNYVKENTKADKFKKRADFVYLILAGLFIGLLVSCNLIFQKFVHLDFFGIYTFEISAGILPYPLTFLVTDLISELFGVKKANRVVFAGLIVSLFIFLVVVLADALPALPGVGLSNEEFSKVFGLTGAAVSASMLAYLLAQFIDIRLFHFWKRLTKGKHLWMRNNFSTISSQLVDTFVVLMLLCWLNVIPWAMLGVLFVNGFLFKLMAAIIDTPFLYGLVYTLRPYLGLKNSDEYYD